MTLNLLVWPTAMTHDWWSWSVMKSTFISIQLFNILQPFHIARYINIHKINRILLILLQILVKTFVSNIIIDLSYNLSKYKQFELFQNCLKWVVYVNTEGDHIWKYWFDTYIVLLKKLHLEVIKLRSNMKQWNFKIKFT